MAQPHGPLSDIGCAARACLGAGLPSVVAPALTIEALADGFAEIVSEGLTSTVVRLISSDALTVDASIRTGLSRLAIAQEARSLAAEALTGRLVELLVDAHIGFVIVKGPAVARFYPSGWSRPYNDIDLLIEPRQFDRAMALFLRHDYTYPPTSLPPWPWFDRYCREGVNLLGAGNVDLHHHLAPWIFGQKLPSREIIDRATQIDIRGTKVPVASPEYSAVIATLHILNDLWKGKRGLGSWRDLIVIIGKVGSVRVREGFAAAGLEWLLDIAVATIRLQLPGFMDDVDARRTDVPRRYRWRMRGLGWDRSTSLSRHRLAWAIRLPVPQAAAFILGSALPSRGYIRIRHGTYRHYWRQAWSESLSTFAGADHRMDKRGAITPT